MKKNTREILIGAGTVALGALALRYFSRNHQPLETVPAVDLTRYAGKWYEIAAFPLIFERGCHCTTAEYSLDPAGYVKVVNSCNRKSPQGKKSVAVGKAFPVPDSNNAKLKVQFQWPFKGDYWIIDLDEDYSHALVGTPDRQNLWVLSRSPFMAPTLYQRLVQVAQQKGFDIDHLHLTNQACFD
ncbi:lipocalin family protein [Adhaeribacter radiodurans]|uniref:Lipocalin family protein n=1 Tax=Adhaeribacter radiodurans TaxID=2745197 RepID=A0A7L7LCM1_9BACT|nr:lipocalin family protein [Adhaeribacter radiodurans]QMU30588.1 lipocalin family protein [Adhaeribacter radiodurans]